MTWETVIGLETHVELATKTKIFCSCTTEFGGAPNTHCCPVCMGMPGTLPVLNEKVVELAATAGLALNCAITPVSRFDRKNYFYPDLPKAYQISQLYLPIARDGAVDIGNGKTIRIHELHMEEDAGKLVHDPWLDQTMADYNRCGVPLIEIVTEPDFRSAEEVIAYLEKLKETLQYLGVSDCKMQEGSLRCDVNLSVRPAGSAEFGTRTEMKNLNSFKAISRAIVYEARRQIELLEEGKRVVQETRRWDENKDATYAMRSKENAQDYRYFPDPDLPPVELSQEYLDHLKDSLPELAESKRARYQTDWGLPTYDAQMITSQKALADFFEALVDLGADPKQGANWIMGEVLGQLSAHGMEAKDMALTPPTLARLIALVKEGKVNRNTAVKVFEAVFETDGDVDAYVKEHGLEQVSDAGLVQSVVDQVLAANEKSVADFKSGKEKAFGFLVGQVMRQLKGQAAPAVVNQVLRERLEQTAE
ncbi:Asp-tRNA(Asn)/Glu-tRNA(Gln) amidotransferase subunit GatB [Intestinimonas massiliensis (ex Afouda et al. 2020)]|uniref:Asp-tRNA(Asn)/Glu-tRNA(Gln) amidotransferase subunit GatB n=1 Tax=Intestinimonas massiliensis (ex Afouda et al. 2020) TaxID=1673721 RepID=UPI0010310795|nr:Asp-tRNA(Asn)/Glu-tRNA(Gln) amidotransferase subunit GatB [Intestinimonas massiliensis (ex Afouda et al. 2020)]